MNFPKEKEGQRGRRRGRVGEGEREQGATEVMMGQFGQGGTSLFHPQYALKSSGVRRLWLCDNKNECLVRWL